MSLGGTPVKSTNRSLSALGVLAALVASAPAHAASQARFEIRGYVPVSCSMTSSGVSNGGSPTASCNSRDQVTTSVREDWIAFGTSAQGWFEPTMSGWATGGGSRSRPSDAGVPSAAEGRVALVRVITVSI